jgi:hypothetical protein
MLTHRHLPTLRTVREMIESEEQSYICFALDDVAKACPALRPTIGEIKAVIRQGLDGRSLFSTWILDQVYPNIAPSDTPFLEAWYNEDGVFRLARLAWLDRLITNITEN